MTYEHAIAVLLCACAVYVLAWAYRVAIGWFPRRRF